MPASITLANLGWSTPDGRALFSNLDLSFDAARTGLVGRNGVGKTTLLRLVSGELPVQAGTVSVNGTLGILRQAVQPKEDETVADLFEVTDKLAVLRRAEDGKAGVDELATADWTLETRMAGALARFDLVLASHARLSTLSGGERTRVALAALAFAEPDFILLDEPTNNLDRDGRKLVIDLLAGWRSGAVVISHDRELLDTMDAIVELTSLGVTRYGGNWSLYRERKAIELATARHDLADAEKRVANIERATQATAERKARKDGAGHRKGARGDIPRIQLGALKNQSEQTSGENARRAERQRTQAVADASAARERIEILQPLSVTLASSGLPSNRTVLRIDRVTAGHEPGRAIVSDFSLVLTGPERVALSGPNGSGKTTVLALATKRLAPWSGTVRVVDDVAMLDQRVELIDPSASIRDNFRRLNPGAGENACRAALARFMFRADAALQTAASLSGGQMLRAGLACVLGGPKPPSLLVLDEPPNHLDIDSIEAIEAGLRAYDGALLAVSHDEAFLDAIAITRRLELPAR